MTKISIIIPVYYNENTLLPLYDDLKNKVLDSIDDDYEIIFVDDGSEDGSFGQILKLASGDSRVRYLKLARNFGSHAAILAGMAQSTGSCAAIKMADMQEPSELILDMFECWKQGNSVVLALREERQETGAKRFFADSYYSMIRRFAMPDMPKGGFDCCLIDRKVIDVLTAMDETNSAITGQILWCGFKRDVVYYKRLERPADESRWTLKKRLKLVLDSIYSFSSLPITLLTTVGAIFAVIAFFMGVYFLVERLMGATGVPGWTSLMLVLLLSTGLILMGLGIIGEYIWRIFDTSRKRPPYIIDEKSSFPDDVAGRV